MALQEADMSTTTLAFMQGDDRTFAEFYLYPQQDKKESLEAGRPIFKEIPYIRIMVPGDKDNVVDRPIREQDKQRYPRQWQAFQMNQEQPVHGTPLESWPSITRSEAEELKYFGIRTVEDLINMPDSHAQKFRGIRALQSKAQNFLDAAQGMAQIDQMHEALRIRDAQITQLTNAVEELQNALRKQTQAEAPAPTKEVKKALKVAATVLDDPEDR